MRYTVTPKLTLSGGIAWRHLRGQAEMAEYVRVQEASDLRDPTRADAQHVDPDELEKECSSTVVMVPPS
jgi:hypothetical protein